MYHIKKDKRQQDSANRIYQSLRHILLKKELKDITITDIYNECGISRMTFYRLFDNINDVLAYKIHFFFEEYKAKSQNQTDKLLFFFEYWNNHRDLIRILNNDALPILLSEFKENENTSISSYKSSLKAAIMASILSNWSIRNGYESPKEMKKIINELFSEKLNLLTDI